MATVKSFIRATGNDNRLVHVRFRLSDGTDVQLFHKSELCIKPSLWDSINEREKYRATIDKREREQFNKSIIERKQLILDTYYKNKKSRIDSTRFDSLLKAQINNDNQHDNHYSFFELFDLFLTRHKLSEQRLNNYMVVKRSLMRFEIYLNIINKDKFTIDIDTLNSELIKAFEDFLFNEYRFYETFPQIYEQVPESRKPKQRGINTINYMNSKVKTFYTWLNENKYTTNNPFDNYNLGESVYGTPYYITIEERNKIMKADLKAYPSLALTRDIFIFQCLIGCRMGDLWMLTHHNVVNDAIEYIANKTKTEQPRTIRVPLNNKAKVILNRYVSSKRESLFPFPSTQKYNMEIKTVFRLAGVTRVVTFMNPITRESEHRPICEVASSHLARRTFIGNLYKKVKDQELISSLSGHAHGSKSFERYRTIDDEIKRELVELID